MSAANWMERRQVPLYLVALAVGAVVGILAPSVAPVAAMGINPVLGLLLYATFLGVPFQQIGRAIRDWRFLGAALVLNFVAVPIVVWLLTRLIAHDEALLVGALFVLLAPCVDYVLVFTGLAGGAKDRLLAAAPLLMLVQMLLLPFYLWLFVGEKLAASVEVAPFVEAFVLLIALPMVAAALTQAGAQRTRWCARLQAGVSVAMVPLMMATLALVVASQIAGVGSHLSRLASVVRVYAVFPVVMIAVGWFAGRLAGLDGPSRRAVVFTGVTRNSLVVLPLVLALPTEHALAPLAVVAQTLVELLWMVAMVRLVPRLIPAR